MGHAHVPLLMCVCVCVCECRGRVCVGWGPGEGRGEKPKRHTPAPAGGGAPPSSADSQHRPTPPGIHMEYAQEVDEVQGVLGVRRPLVGCCVAREMRHLGLLVIWRHNAPLKRHVAAEVRQLVDKPLPLQCTWQRQPRREKSQWRSWRRLPSIQQRLPTVSAP